MTTIGLNAFSNNGGYNGPGIATTAEVEELNKALETGYAIGAGRTGGAALRVESLEASLKVLTYSASHIKFWKKIHKSPAYSTVEEYNQLSDYGGSATPWVGEGQLPQASDSSYARRTQLVKFLGTVREVTHQASLVHPAHGDLIALENHNGIMYLLEQVEKFLFSGDSSLAFNGEAKQWDGLDSLIDSTSVLDLEGQSLSEAVIEEASNEVLENYGFPTDMFLGFRAMSDLVKVLYPRQRVMMPAPQNGKIGQTVGSIATQGGDIEFCPDVFIRKTPTAPSAATSTSAPATPASITAAVDGSSTDGDFTKAEANPGGDDDYTYVVTAANQYGESAPTAIPGAVSESITAAERAAGRNIELTITNAGTIGAFPPEYFKVYRTTARVTGGAVPSDLSEYALVLQVPAASQAAGATTVVDDLNLTLPFTSTAYLGELTPSVLTFRQLMPMMKMDLAVLSPAYRWMIMLYGTPIMFAPRKWIRLINVGDLDSVG